MKLAVIVIAGGKGSRMESDIPKPLHEIGGIPLLGWTLKTLNLVNPEQKIVVVGLNNYDIFNRFNGSDITWVIQPDPKGNGEALARGLVKVTESVDTVLTLFPDCSMLYKPTTIEEFVLSHNGSGAVASMLGVDKNDITPNYRIKNEGNRFINFEKLTNEEKLQSKYFFTGCACFKKEWILRRVNNIPIKEGEKEISLPTIFDMAREEKEHVNIFRLADENEWVGVNTKNELIIAESILRNRKERW